MAASAASAASRCLLASGRLAPAALARHQQPRRSRHQQDPGTLGARLIRAVTEPVIRRQPPCDTERRLRVAETARRQLEDSGFLNYLTAECRREVFDAAEGKMMLLMELLPNRVLLGYSYTNALHQLGYSMPRRYRYPNQVAVRAATGTMWQPLAQLFLAEGLSTAMAIGPAEPPTCLAALRVIDASPYLVLLGGVASDRMLTARQVREFAQLPDLSVARSRLIGALNEPAEALIGALGRPAEELVTVLEGRRDQLTGGGCGAVDDRSGG